MSNRFPPLATPAIAIAVPRRPAQPRQLPRWLQSLPLGELLLLAGLGLVLALA